MKTTRETKWKVAAVGLLVAAAALTVQVWRTHSSECYYTELTCRAVAQMQQQAQGAGGFSVAQNVPIPNFW